MMMDNFIFTKKDIKDLNQREMRQYRSEIGRMTPQERNDLREWVAAGNSPYSNPYLMVWEGGYSVDYITAMRDIEDMRLNPEKYGIGYQPDIYDCDTEEETTIGFNHEDELPF
jgi:hypothetical protein